MREKTGEVAFENQKCPLRYKRARIYSAQLGRFISRDPLGFVDGMSLYRAYFVPNYVDPTGRSYQECVDSCVHEFLIRNPEIYYQNPQGVLAACRQSCRRKNPPTFPPNVGPGGTVGPYLPEDGGINVNIWGEGESEGFTDYEVAGCPDPGKPNDARPSTGTIPDKSVDQVFIRSSPWRCECEMKEICRICRDGCVVTVSMPQIDFENETWMLGAPAPFFQTREEMLQQFKKCMGDRLKKFQFIKQENEDGTGIASLTFRLGKGACGTCPDKK